MTSLVMMQEHEYLLIGEEPSCGSLRHASLCGCYAQISGQWVVGI